jgi:hypothetical protein
MGTVLRTMVFAGAWALAACGAAPALGSANDSRQDSVVDARSGTRAPDATLCSTGEHAVFSCDITGNEARVSLCASPDVSRNSGYMYYAYGTDERIEPTYPSNRESPTRYFSRTYLALAGGSGGYAYSFVDAGVKHVLYSISGKNGLERQGALAVDASGNVLATLKCKPGTFVEEDAVVLRTLVKVLPADESIAQRGLPLSD